MDNIADWSGQCLCGPNSVQNTAFGCSIISKSALQRRQAPVYSYAEFSLQATDNPVYAGTLSSLGSSSVQGASASVLAQRCRDLCNSNSACIGFFLSTYLGLRTCFLGAQSPVTDVGLKSKMHRGQQ
jgi:hypothetical protein